MISTSVPSALPLVKNGRSGSHGVYPSFPSHCVYDIDKTPPTSQYVIPGLIAVRDLVLWIGKEKARKTNLILQLSVSVAIGRPFLWFGRTEPKRVCMFDYESKDTFEFGITRRMESILSAMNATGRDRDLVRENLQILEFRKARQLGFTIPPFSDKPEELSWWRRHIKEHPAELYIVDPLRSFHRTREDDSTIERVLSLVMAEFSTVIVCHHMRKDQVNQDGGKSGPSLTSDMRSWSDGARGSGAIKAHSDVIICQERREGGGEETIYLGAFGKDFKDVSPVALKETGPLSYLWECRGETPVHLEKAVRVLKKTGESFVGKAEVIKLLVKSGTPQATAYRHYGELVERRVLAEENGRLKFKSERAEREME